MVRYENEIRIICNRAWENRSYLHILYFEKYEFEILNALLFSCGAIQSRQIKTHDSESQGQEEPATTEWVIYKEHRQKTHKCSSQAAKTASAQLSQP